MGKLNVMIQGTTTDAGKSTLVAGLCRWLANNGYSVAPFKPQNMALNSAVTADGGEIGRAQAAQATACRIPPHTDMNPVLLKPASDTGAQVIIHGRVLKNMDARDFHSYKPRAMAAVMASYERLNARYENVVIEGAGSPAEINLRDGDIANMGFAEKSNCPVILVADIDKGGVFAHIVGTLALLSQTEQQRILGFIINKFRGDISLLESGLQWLENYTGKPVFGVLPYLNNLYLESEDAIATQQTQKKPTLNVVVPVLPHISNHTDFDALRMHPEINLQLQPLQELPQGCDLIILPGSKNVSSDLQHLIASGWREYIETHLRYKGKVMGICGGYQMLGKKIYDPNAIESNSVAIDGLGIIPMTSTLAPEKTLAQASGTLTLKSKTCSVSGYEIHNGQSVYERNPKDKTLPITARTNAPIQLHNGINEGFICENNQVFATYLHGIFDTPEACQLILQWAGLHQGKMLNIQQIRDRELERLATAFEQHIDLPTLCKTVQQFNQQAGDTQC